MIVFLLMLACTPDAEELPCREGFSRAPSGHCYPDEPLQAPSSLDDLYELLEPCHGLRPSNGMDLESGCAGELCQGDLYDVAVAKLGPPETCFEANDDAYCTWPSGLGGRWDDEDDDLLPDPGTRNQRVNVTAPFAYGTKSGLGLWMPYSCYVDQLGPPDDLTLVDTEDGLFIERMNFEGVGLLAYDLYDLDGRSGADGLLDTLYLYGAP